MNHKHFAAGVKARRKQFQFTQKDVAEFAVVTRSAVCNIERGRSKPALDTAMLIAQRLEMSIEDLEALGRNVLSNG